MINKEEFSAGLIRQIKSFGLNPREWIVQTAMFRDGPGIRLNHVKDKNFRMYGRIRRTASGHFKISRLALSSL